MWSWPSLCFHRIKSDDSANTPSAWRGEIFDFVYWGGEFCRQVGHFLPGLTVSKHQCAPLSPGCWETSVCWWNRSPHCLHPPTTHTRESAAPKDYLALPDLDPFPSWPREKPTTASGASKLSWFPASPLPEPFSLSFLRFFFSFSFFTDVDPLSVLSVLAKTPQLRTNPQEHKNLFRPTRAPPAGGETPHLVGFWGWTCRVCVWCQACRGIHRPYRNCQWFVS